MYYRRIINESQRLLSDQPSTTGLPVWYWRSISIATSSHGLFSYRSTKAPPVSRRGLHIMHICMSSVTLSTDQLLCDLIVGKSTSLIAGWSVNSITRRSIPYPFSMYATSRHTPINTGFRNHLRPLLHFYP